MAIATYIIGVEDVVGGQNQVLISCIANGILTSSSSTTLPQWISFQDSQSNWTESTTSAIGYIKNKPSLATVATSGSYNDLSNKPTIPSITPLSFANPTRTLNSGYQISTTRNAFVSYAVDISSTLTLTGGATGTVFVDYADDSGFTTNLVTVNSTANGNTGALTIGLSLTQLATASVSGIIPAGKYVRIRTANTSGTPTFTFRSAQEVLL